MKLISFIIPHYNNWDMLVELLSTIPAHEMIEIIIIDDNSTDNKNEMNRINETFPNVRFLMNDSGKKGAGAARNIGIINATGKWILFADSDDKFEEDLFDKIEPYLNTDYDLIYFSPKSFSESNLNESKRHLRYSKYVENYISDNNAIENELNIRYKFIVPWSKLIRHAIVRDNNLFFEEIPVSNDILFSAKIGYSSNDIHAVNDTIYYVRQREGSLTSTINKEKLIMRFNAWKDYANYLSKNLSKSEFELLKLNSFPYLIKSLKVDNKISTLWYIYKESKRNNIPVIDTRIFNFKKLYKILSR